MLTFRKLTPAEIAARETGQPMTVSQLRREHYARKAAEKAPPAPRPPNKRRRGKK